MGVAASTQAQLGTMPGRVRMPLSRYILWIQRAETNTASQADHGTSTAAPPWNAIHPPNANSKADVRGTMPQATG